MSNICEYKPVTGTGLPCIQVHLVVVRKSIMNKNKHHDYIMSVCGTISFFSILLTINGTSNIYEPSEFI
jgi:hypothetical protein